MKTHSGFQFCIDGNISYKYWNELSISLFLCTHLIHDGKAAIQKNKSQTVALNFYNELKWTSKALKCMDSKKQPVSASRCRATQLKQSDNERKDHEYLNGF